MLYENNSLNLTFLKFNRIKIRRRRKKRRRGKHLYSFFLSRKKKFLLYYQPFDSVLQKKNIKVNFKSSYILEKKKSYRIGLKALKLDLIRIMCLKGLKFSSQKFLRSIYLDKFFKYNVSTVPDYWLTSKPKSVRMGKGKGEMKFKVSFIEKGIDIYNIKYLHKIHKFTFDKKLYIYKFNIFFWFLMKILKAKPSVKTEIYKKIY